MLYYRGDKFVKGKKFTINEAEYRFIRKTKNEELVFESIKDNSTLKILESEFKGVETLVEKIVKYNLVEADDAKLDEFYNDSSLTFEGCTTDKENIDFLYKWLKDLGCIKEGNSLDIYHYTGSLMNNKYQLTGSNKYPEDLNIITVMLKDIAFNGRLPLARMELGGRWFDDIVDNNKRREGINESVSYSNQTLLEKINQTNKEMNELIGKILRSKALARKNEELLAKHGIKIDYDQGQGVILIGPNGKRLVSTTKEVHGPSKPGHNDTHKRDTWYAREYQDYEKRVEEREKALADLKNMDRDDIIRKYNTKSTEEALKAHEEDIKRSTERLDSAKHYRDEYKNEARHELDKVKRTRRAGHKGNVSYFDKDMNKEVSNQKVDYLNYLTKKDYENPTKKVDAHNYIGDFRQSPDDSKYYKDRYYGKHGKPEQSSENINKYRKFKSDIESAEDDVRRSSQGSGSWRSYKSEEELEAEITKMREDLEKRIQSLRAENNNRKAGNAEDIQHLEDRKKELDDFLKGLGIRESARAKLVKQTILAESARLKEESFNDDYREIYGEDASFTNMRRIVEELQAIYETADNDGFKYSERLNKVIRELSDLTMKIEEFYNF